MRIFNSKLRRLKAEQRVPWAMVADVLGVAESTLFYWMRHPLNPERKKLIEDAIIQASNEQQRE